MDLLGRLIYWNLCRINEYSRRSTITTNAIIHFEIKLRIRSSQSHQHLFACSYISLKNLLQSLIEKKKIQDITDMDSIRRMTMNEQC